MPDLSLTSPGATEEAFPDFPTRLHRSFLPGFLMFHCIRELIRTVINEPLSMRDWQKFRHHAFAIFWLRYGKCLSIELPGRTIELVNSANGLVLDVGPGDGSVVHLFDPDKIDMVYAPEPAVDLHPRLMEKVKEVGLTGKYEPLACGAEPDSLVPALAKAGLLKSDGSSASGIFDTVMSTRVLCGVPQPAETAKQLFELLKPGGRLIVCEHISSPWPAKGTFLGWLFQTFYWSLGWNLWMGGCTINRNTVRYLREAGGDAGWRSIELNDVDPWHPVPFVVGVLEKA